MQIGIEGLVIITTIVAFSYLAYSTYADENLERVVSKIDNREYLVQDKDDAKAAADLIAEIRQKLILLVSHLIKSYPNDERVLMLKENFDPDALREGKDNSGYTSYSINKGEKVVLCLRNSDSLVDLNTMMFVSLHEVAHICTADVGHTDTYWKNFRWILEESINIGIYTHQDFDKSPVEYCGMQITSTPYNG